MFPSDGPNGTELALSEEDGRLKKPRIDCHPHASATFEKKKMDRLIWTAWRAFWVGLGASAVLIAQSLLAPELPAAATTPAPPAVIEPASPAVASPARVKSADPILSRNPFDSTRGKVVARVRNET
jgi:hypothetical protein